MFDDASQILGSFHRQATLAKQSDIAFYILAAVGKTKQTFVPLLKKLVQIVGELRRVDDADQFYVVLGKHQAVVGCTPADMTPSRAGGKAQFLPVLPRCFKILNADQDVIE